MVSLELVLILVGPSLLNLDAVINGPKIHPGATNFVDGRMNNIGLSPDQKMVRTIISGEVGASRRIDAVSGKINNLELGSEIVYRHLKDGDIVLVNRQNSAAFNMMMKKKRNSAERVESCEDLLIQILVLLPPKSLFKFIYVSKRWENIIKTPFFIQSYGRHHSGGRLLAYFQVRRSTSWTPRSPRRINIIPTTRGCARYLPKKFGYFAGSSDGLILTTPDHNTYFVINPVTRRSVSLPPPPHPSDRFNLTSAGLMCEENLTELVPRYTIIRAQQTLILPKSMEIQTYSSDTHRWSETTLTSAEPFILIQENPMVKDGVYHWNGYKNWDILVLVHDTRKSNRSNSIQVIKLPFLCRRIGRSNDGILWTKEVVWDGSIKLWALPKVEEGQRVIEAQQWEMMYVIELKHRFCWIDFSSWDPIILLVYRRSRFGKGLFYYNVESGLLKKIGHGGFFATGSTTNIHYDVIPLFQSSFLSSYFL